MVDRRSTARIIDTVKRTVQSTIVTTRAILRESRPFRSSALSFPGAKSPQRELSLPWNFRSVEHSLLETFTPVELSFIESERSKNFRSLERSNVPRTFVPMKLSFHNNEYS